MIEIESLHVYLNGNWSGITNLLCNNQPLTKDLLIKMNQNKNDNKVCINYVSKLTKMWYKSVADQRIKN